MNAPNRPDLIVALANEFSAWVRRNFAPNPSSARFRLEKNAMLSLFADITHGANATETEVTLTVNGVGHAPVSVPSTQTSYNFGAVDDLNGPFKPGDKVTGVFVGVDAQTGKRSDQPFSVDFDIPSGGGGDVVVGQSTATFRVVEA